MSRDLACSFSQPACSAWPLSVAHRAAAAGRRGGSCWRGACRGLAQVELRLFITFCCRSGCCPEVSVANQQEIELSAERVRKEAILSQTGALFPPWSTASKGRCLTGRVSDQVWFARLRLGRSRSLKPGPRRPLPQPRRPVLLLLFLPSWLSQLSWLTPGKRAALCLDSCGNLCIRTNCTSLHV